MKTLVVMRHGKALPLECNQQDVERSLTKAGIMALDARLPRMLRLLETGDGTVQIWASPAKRARQTAELLEKALEGQHVRIEKKIEPHESLWDQDVDAFLAELYNSDAEFVFAVGHVPFVEDVVEELAGSTPCFSTGALGCLEVGFASEDEEKGVSVEDDSPARASARLLWFVQGPVSAHWETLARLQKAIAKTAEKIEEQREAFFADPDDIETIHHFRTNIRSLRSLLAFVKPWQEAEQNAEMQAILKQIVGHTSRLRELDVFEKQARSNPDSSSKLLRFCKKEASAERAKVLKALSSKQVVRSFERAMDLAKSVDWKGHYIKHGLPASVVRARFDAMVESTKADLAALKLSDEEQTHDVRKRAKRARYVSERCDKVLGADAVDIAKGMTAHQDDLGDVCDARVNIRLISEFLQQDLPEVVVWELNLMRAQNEAYLYGILKASEAK